MRNTHGQLISLYLIPDDVNIDGWIEFSAVMLISVAFTIEFFIMRTHYITRYARRRCYESTPRKELFSSRTCENAETTPANTAFF